MKYDRVIKIIFYFAIALFFIYFISIAFSFYVGRGLSDKQEGKVGLIEIEGIIISSESFVKQIKRFEKDDSVKAVVLRIDSPGGGVAPAQEIYNEILKFKEKTGKKVVVSFGSIAASGGYYIACPADKIVSNPGTITGSIGVIMKIPSLQGLFHKIGYEEQIVKSGKLKDIGSVSRSMTSEERDILEDMAKDVHDQFIEAVANTRNIEMESLRKFSDGRIFSGRKAKELGLVDRLGTYEDAIDLAIKLSGLSEDAKVVKEKKDRSFFDLARDFLDKRSLINPFSWSPLTLQYIVF